MKTGILIVFALALVAGHAAAQPADGNGKGTIAITGATVYQRSDKKIENATIVIRDGKIAELGAGVAAPAGAKIIDGKGKVVAAGFVEAYSQLGLIDIDGEEAAHDGRFAAKPSDEVHAAFRTVDAYNARSVGIPVARTGGVTAAVSGPTGGLVSGQAAFASLADAGAPLRAPIAINAALGRVAIAARSRGHAAERLRELLEDADAYRRNRGGFDRNQSRRLAADRLDLQALIPVLEGRLTLVIAADAEIDIRTALAIAAERRLRIAIAGGGEAWRLAKQLAAAKVPVILDPTQNLPNDLGALDVRDDNATILAKAGVPVAISTLGNQSQARTLRQLAGVAIGYGMPWEKALDAITTVPAQIYGIRDRGALDRGGPADLVVWSGDPLEIASRAEAVIIGGVVQPLDTHQTRLLQRYRKLPKR